MYTLRQKESGLALIEMMVLLILIGIILAIAIPTFIGINQQDSEQRVHVNTQVCGITGHRVLLPGSTNGTYFYGSASKLVVFRFYDLVLDKANGTIVSYKLLSTDVHAKRC